MSVIQRCFVMVALTAFAGCASEATVPTVGNYNVYSSYSDKVPGKYGLYVDGSEFKDKLVCGAFPASFDAEVPFRLSAQKTIANIVNDIELLDQPVDAQTATARGLDGVILVRGEETDTDLNLGAPTEVEVELAASVEAFRNGKRVLGTTVEGDGEAALTGLCPGLGENLGDAVGEAMKDLLGKVGERIANAERLR